jgi:hypothetical protein
MRVLCIDADGHSHLRCVFQTHIVATDPLDAVEEPGVVLQNDVPTDCPPASRGLRLISSETGRCLRRHQFCRQPHAHKLGHSCMDHCV